MGSNSYSVSPAAPNSADIFVPVATNAVYNDSIYTPGATPPQSTYYTLNANGDNYVLVTFTDTQPDSGNSTQHADNRAAQFNSRSVTWYVKKHIGAGDPHIVGQTGVFNLPRTQELQGVSANPTVSLIEKPAGQRLANASKVRVEIRTGKDSSIFELKSIYIDYIKAPQYIRLTQEQIDLTEDTSQMMEFPDYVCQEIINELTHLIMENSSDQRLQSHMPVTMSIANPAQG